jgi:hypothetical protein
MVPQDWNYRRVTVPPKIKCLALIFKRLRLATLRIRLWSLVGTLPLRLCMSLRLDEGLHSLTLEGVRRTTFAVSVTLPNL